ncbi:MAG: S8 family serine peptidase [Afipia sp.]|nr:S8 family serine peptidase [Afipia sp.]
MIEIQTPNRNGFHRRRKAFVTLTAVAALSLGCSHVFAQGYGYSGGSYNPPPQRYYDQSPPDSSAAPRPRRPRPAQQVATDVPADDSYVSKEVLIEVDGKPTEQQVDSIAKRHRLTRTQSQSFPLTGSTYFRWTISDGRSVDDVVRELLDSGDVKSAQRNNVFKLQEEATVKAEGDPAQYGLTKLRLPQAHALSVGADVTIAVIDSGIDIDHPELAGRIAGSFDALGSKEGPHIHGTSVASTIVAHGRLMGAAPSAKLLAIRAFGAQDNAQDRDANSTSFVVIKSLDYAVSNRAQIINMSFAGPRDKAIQRSLAAAAKKGIVLIAAAGNAGAKSPPLFPAADGNVIAVSATDQSDNLFTASNRGRYIAISAPGVDILSAAPDGKYQIISGTSLAAAYVSGVAALMISRSPDIASSDLRATLLSTARDLGPPGRDDQFGAGQVDALGAVSAVATPMATASDRPATRQ